MAGQKRKNAATTSGPMNEYQKERPQMDKYCTRDRLRVKIHAYSLQQLEEIENDLNFRFHGHAVDWLLPSDLKGLVDLTQELGYEFGGETIDWLLTVGIENEGLLNFRQELGSQNNGEALNLSLQQEAASLVELTGELGFNRVGETVDWLLEMATNPMLELMNLLGFKDGVSTVDWLLQQAQPGIVAIQNGFNPHPNLMLQSAMNIPNISTFQPPANQSQIHNPDAQSHQQLQSTAHWFREKQGWNQFQSSGSGHQGENPFFNGNEGSSSLNNGESPFFNGHEGSSSLNNVESPFFNGNVGSSSLNNAESPFFNWNEGSSSLNNGVKRIRKDIGCSNHVGNQLESQCPSGHLGSQATSQIERATANPAEGLTQNVINGADGGSAGGFQGGSTYQEEMPLEAHAQNNSVITGNSFEQNDLSQFPDPTHLLDYYFPNYNFFDNMPYQNQDQFGNNHDQSQNQFVNTSEQK